MTDENEIYLGGLYSSTELSLGKFAVGAGSEALVRVGSPLLSTGDCMWNSLKDQVGVSS